MSHLTSKFKSTPTFSFKARHSTITSSNQSKFLPSPQDYNVDQFNIATNVKKRIKFSKQRKSCSFDPSQQTPGPGQYEQLPLKSLISFNKMQVLRKGAERFKQFKSISPAPGKYEINDSNKKSAPRFSISKLKRSLKEIAANNSNPGPDLYHPCFSVRERSVSASISFQKRAINIQRQKTPGPGSYETDQPFLSASFNHKKQIFPKAGRSNSSSVLQRVPGPGNYQFTSSFVEDLQKKRGFTWQKKVSSPSIKTPGPGSYEANSPNHKFRRHSGVSICKSQRHLFTGDSKRLSVIPGPGQHDSSYLQYSKFKSASASKFSKARLPSFVKPKPNNGDFLNPQKMDWIKSSTPSFSITRSKRQELFQGQTKRTTPDKFYDTNVNFTKQSERTFKIPKTQRLRDSVPTALGPGYYNYEPVLLPSSKVKFSKQKRTTFMDQAISSKLKIFQAQTYQQRQQFPNPPKYSNTYKKLQINQKKIIKF